MNPIDTRRVLRSQSRRRTHSIAAMRRNDFLIGFEAPARFARSARCVLQQAEVPCQHKREVKLTPHQSCPSQLSRECASWSLRISWYCGFNRRFFESLRCFHDRIVGDLRTRLTSSNACFGWVCATTYTVWSCMHQLHGVVANIHCLSCFNINS